MGMGELLPLRSSPVTMVQRVRVSDNGGAAAAVGPAATSWPGRQPARPLDHPPGQADDGHAVGEEEVDELEKGGFSAAGARPAGGEAGAHPARQVAALPEVA